MIYTKDNDLLFYKMYSINWIKKFVLYRNRLYKAILKNDNVFILNSKNKLINIKSKKYIIIKN